MHPDSTPPNPPAPSLLQEPAAVLEDLGEVVLNDDQNLIISSQDKEAMLHAAQSLQAFWRNRAPTVAVEHFSGDQRLALLRHINQGIAQLGLEQAMQKPLPPYLPKQIAIITHAELLPASDVQMLQDLTRHLPGLCWRWVLLRMETDGHGSAVVPSENASAPISGSMAEPAPSAPSAPAVALEPLALEEKVEPFLDPGEPLVPVKPFAPAEAVVSAETAALAQSPIVSAPHLTPPVTPPADTTPASTRPTHRWAWLGLAAMVGLGAWGAWLRFGVPQPAPSGAAERAATSASTSAASSPETPLPSASASQPIDPAAANTPPSQATAAVPAAAPAEPAAQTPASAPADPSAEVPDVALRGVRWLAQQSPEFYVLEHGSFKTAAQAQSLIKTRTELANARVLMLKTAAAGGRFLVITGPFRSQERAHNFQVRENLPPQIPVRQVSDVLKESVRAAPSRP
jgi:cell division septation protein DedD